MNQIFPSLPVSIEADYVDQLSKASRKMRTAFDAKMAAHGLTLARARALLQLRRHPTITQSALAGELALEGATVVRLLDGMEKQDLVRRRAVEGDRRAKHVVLTAHGRAQAETVEAIAAEFRTRILAGASQAELAAGLGVLSLMTRNLEAIGGNEDA